MLSHGDFGDQERSIRNEFGDILYTVLQPINGYPLKNRRYADGNHKNEGRDTATGPAVHHKIGQVGSWSSKASWYTADQVWDNLKQEHVDLTHNGIKSRKDHVEVMQEFYDAKVEIKDILHPKDADGATKDLQVEFTLDEPMEVECIHNTEVDGMLCIKGTWKRKIKKGLVKAGSVSFLVPNLNNDEEAEDQLIQLNIGADTMNVSFKYQQSWKQHVAVIGLDNIVIQESVVNAYKELGKEYKRGFEIWQTLKDKYAGRVLLKGAF